MRVKRVKKKPVKSGWKGGPSLRDEGCKISWQKLDIKCVAMFVEGKNPLTFPSVAFLSFRSAER
jgi:hypothetical protein